MKDKRIIVVLFMLIACALSITGCIDNNKENNDYQKVEWVGQVPKPLEKVIKNNTFKDIVAFEGRVLKTETVIDDATARTATHQIQMMDVYGNELATYKVSSSDAYHIRTLTATKDGGFLFVLGFADYTYDGDSWASENGFASRVIKCDKSGKLQFDTAFDSMEGNAFEFCFEKDEKYYFFGTLQNPETKKQGVHSKTDVSMFVLDKNGSVLKSQYTEGSEFDSLQIAEDTEEGFLLSIRAQSKDGDFVGTGTEEYSAEWVFAVNDELEIVEKKKEAGRDYFDTKTGEKDGRTVYKSNTIFDGFDAGEPSAYIGYEDFYVIVSENITGIYENIPPTVSSIWFYTETVYSGYDDSGELIFRVAVDSSADYDTW